MTVVGQNAAKNAHDTLVVGATRFDFYASLVAAAVAILVGGMIWADVSFFDLGRRSGAASGQSVARIDSARNVVRKKSGDLPIWSLASPGEVLFTDDYVFTDANSSVRLRFADQDEIALDQNTMIQVRRFEGEMSLGLLKGALRAEGKGAGNPIVIQVGKQGTILRTGPGAKVDVRARDDGKGEIAVLSGQAEVLRGNEKVVLAAAEVATADESGAIVKGENPTTLLDEPFDRARVSLGPEQPLTFSWTVPGDVKSVWFELARDEGFSDLILSKETSDSRISLETVPAGAYHWRVRAGEPSVSRAIMIARRSPPALLWPEDGATVGKTTTSLTFAWKGHEDVRSYRVEVGSTPEMTPPLLQETTEGASFAIALPAPGAYYWRVKESEHGAWSAVRTFTIGDVTPEAQPEEEVLPPPALDEQYEIVVPKKGAFLWESLLGVGVAYASDDTPVMRWPAVKDASAYAIQISKQEGFATILRDEDVLAPFFSFEGFEPGVYFIRIATRNARGVKGPYSKPVRVVISLPAPRLVAPVNGVNFEHGVAIAFDWRRVEGAKGYRVEIARDAAFKSIVRTEAPPLSSVEVKGAEAGSYFWRVSAVSQDGQSGPYSSVGRFIVAEAPRPASAPVVAPLPPPPPPSPQETEATNVASSPAPPRLAPRRMLVLGAAPTRFTYAGGRRTPGIDLDATLFNSYFLNASAAVTPHWTMNVSARRTATELFADEAPSPGQQSVKIEPVTASLAATVRVQGEGSTWWGVKAGVGHQTLLRFSEDAARLVSVRHVALVEPLIGWTGEWGFDARWRLRGAVDYFIVAKASDVTGGSHWSGEASLLQTFPDSAYFALYGLRLENARYALSNAAGGGDLANGARSLMIGLGIQL